MTFQIAGGDVSNATSEVNSTISNSMSESMTFWPTTVKPKLPMRKGIYARILKYT